MQRWSSGTLRPAQPGPSTAKLTEKSNQIHQEQIGRAESQRQVLEVELEDCQQKRDLAIQEKDVAVQKHEVLREHNAEERKESVHDFCQLAQYTMDVIEECNKLCKDAENDAWDRVQRHDSGYDDESDSASEQLAR